MRKHFPQVKFYFFAALFNIYLLVIKKHCFKSQGDFGNSPNQLFKLGLEILSALRPLPKLIYK